MNHLLLKLNPKYLAQMPYVGVLRSNIDSRAKFLGVNINTYGKIYAMPNIAGFVGGDTVGVILASDIHKSEDIKCAIDIGTNGELVMGNRDRLISCSTAAGPAFEGARITHGMRASDGAIEKVVINEYGIDINTIGNAAGEGAKMVLLAKELRNEACAISKNTEYIELAMRKDFQDEFMDAMFFPACLTCA